MQLHRTVKGSVTDLEGLKPVLIGRVLVGTELVPTLGPKFQHRPPKKVTVELFFLDGSKKLQCLDWVKQLMLKFVLQIDIVIVLIQRTFKLEIVESIFCITYPMSQLAIVALVIALNNQFQTLSKISNSF